MRNKLQNNLQPTLLPLPEGITILPKMLNRQQQEKFVVSARQIVAQAPLFAPRMWNGKEFKVRVTSCGRVGWFADERGYKYLNKHPRTNRSYPSMPPSFRNFAKLCAAEVLWARYKPDTCLINFYERSSGRLGLHVDDTEEDLISPIVTLSLGDSCIFEIGGLKREDRTQKVRLDSGDVVVMHRAGRNLFHGVKELIPGTSDLLTSGGRISLTFRKAML